MWMVLSFHFLLVWVMFFLFLFVWAMFFLSLFVWVMICQQKNLLFDGVKAIAAVAGAQNKAAANKKDHIFKDRNAGLKK